MVTQKEKDRYIRLHTRIKLAPKNKMKIQNITSETGLSAKRIRQIKGHHKE